MQHRQLEGMEAIQNVHDLPTEVQALLCRLAVASTDTESLCTPCTINETPHEVLMDVEANGIRCLLVRAQSRPPRMQDHLSPREQEIARLVAEGYPDKTIAAVLDISANTVNTYVRRMFAKLGVNTRAAMVARLLEANPSRESTVQTILPPVCKALR